MKGFSKSRFDVKQWPNDQDAQAALNQFFDEIDPNGHFIPVLSGGGLDFAGADLSGLELDGAELSAGQLVGVRLRGTSLYSAWIRQANLQRADLTGADLRKALITHCNAQDSVLAGAALSDADFSDTDLRGADLSSTQLDDAFMHGTDLRGADLRESSWGTIPRNAVLTDAKLGGAKVASMTGDVSDTLDVGTDSPMLLRGRELQQWFVDNGAPNVRVH